MSYIKQDESGGGDISGSGATNQVAFFNGTKTITSDSDFTVNATSGRLAVTGGVNIPTGSAAAPAIAITGDTDTGVFSAGANQIGFTVAGSDALGVGANKNVTVGGTSGTAGQVLTSGGSGGATTWTTVSGGGSSFAPTASVFRQSSPRTSLTALSPYGFGDFQNSNHATSLERIFFAPFIAPETVTIDTLDVRTNTASLSSTNILLGIYTATEAGSGASFSRCPDALQMTATAATTVAGYSGGAVSAASGGSTTINQGELYYVAYAPVAASALASQMQTVNTQSRCLIGISTGNSPQTVLQYLPYSYGDAFALSFPTTYLSSAVTTGSQPLHVMYTV